MGCFSSKREEQAGERTGRRKKSAGGSLDGMNGEKMELTGGKEALLLSQNRP
jgi:hypothetical protein